MVSPSGRITISVITLFSKLKTKVRNSTSEEGRGENGKKMGGEAPKMKKGETKYSMFLDKRNMQVREGNIQGHHHNGDPAAQRPRIL